MHNIYSLSNDDKAREKIKQGRWKEGVEATILNRAVIKETCVW